MGLPSVFLQRQNAFALDALDLNIVLQIADRVYVLRRGRVELAGTPKELRGNLDAIESSYLAGGAPKQG